MFLQTDFKVDGEVQSDQYLQLREREGESCAGKDNCWASGHLTEQQEQTPIHLRMPVAVPRGLKGSSWQAAQQRDSGTTTSSGQQGCGSCSGRPQCHRWPHSPPQLSCLRSCGRTGRRFGPHPEHTESCHHPTASSKQAFSMLSERRASPQLQLKGRDSCSEQLQKNAAARQHP